MIFICVQTKNEKKMEKSPPSLPPSLAALTSEGRGMTDL